MTGKGRTGRKGRKGSRWAGSSGVDTSRSDEQQVWVVECAG